jgi:hypothetical protein
MKIGTMGRLLMWTVALLLAGASARAHHSFTAEFDRERPITLKGIVYKVIDEETGQVESWGVELAAPAVLRGRGWGPDSLTIGEEVTVDGWMSRNGLPRINSRQVVMTSTGRPPGETP